MRRAISAHAAVRCARTNSVISQGDDIAWSGLGRLLGGDPHRDGAVAAVAVDRGLSLARRWPPRRAGSISCLSSGAFSSSGWSRASASLEPISFSADRLRMPDMALAVDADDAGAGAGQHRLGERRRAVDEIARPHESLRWVRNSWVIY